MVDVTPCKGCEQRYIGCHGSCLDYLDWKQRREANNQRRKEYYEATRFLTEAQIRGKKKCKK